MIQFDLDEGLRFGALRFFGKRDEIATDMVTT
jgi:hypothetical protein